MRHISPNLILATFILVPAAIAVTVTSTSNPAPRATPVEPLRATAQIIDLSGRTIGSAQLTEAPGGGVTIALAAHSLPEGKLAWHIHQVGQCETSQQFKTAGDHFNPLNKSHGFKHGQGHHAGDLPNLNVSEAGIARTTVTTPNITLLPGTTTSVMDADGSAIIIHSKADDYTSQPAGDAGTRIACAIIQPAS